MNHHHKSFRSPQHQTPYERLSQRIDDCAKRESRLFEDAKIQRLRVALWGDAALEKPTGDFSTPHPTLSPTEAEREGKR